MVSVVDRLLSKVEMDPNGGCWLWSGSHDRAGYGRIRSEGRLDGVHRVPMDCLSGQSEAKTFCTNAMCDAVAIRSICSSGRRPTTWPTCTQRVGATGLACAATGATIGN